MDFFQNFALKQWVQADYFEYHEAYKRNKYFMPGQGKFEG